MIGNWLLAVCLFIHLPYTLILIHSLPSINSAFNYLPMDTHKEKNYLDAEGKVITAQPNIRTNPESKHLQKRLPHIADPYDRPREFRLKDAEKHKKLMGDKVAFRTTVFGCKNFNGTRKVFGEEGLNIKVSTNESHLYGSFLARNWWLPSQWKS